MLTGRLYDVFAKTVVNAAGPFADSVRSMADNERQAIKPSAGTHVTLPTYYGSVATGLLMPATEVWCA